MVWTQFSVSSLNKFIPHVHFKGEHMQRIHRVRSGEGLEHSDLPVNQNLRLEVQTSFQRMEMKIELLGDHKGFFFSYHINANYL